MKSRILAVLVVLVPACGAADEVESHIECDAICEKYADCYDSDYDIEECASDCRAEFDEDADYLDKIDACDSCIEDKSCSESTFECTDECVGIVP